MQHPRRNQYTLKADHSKIARRETGISASEADRIRNASALIAEIEAEELDRAGLLSRDYQIPQKAAPGQEPTYRTQRAYNNRLQDRDTVSGYWLDTLGAKYRGNFPFGPENNGYEVYRNVKDHGAKGDGKTDDTKAINDAITSGNRCGEGCGGTTVKGATVYFPPGTYLVSSSIVALYNTQLVGNPDDLPILMAAPSFNDPLNTGAVISSDSYIDGGGGASWYLNQANFYRQVRNFVIDVSNAKMDAVRGIHWQVAQATSLHNIHFIMKSGSTQQGIFIENGSGGFVSELTFQGGESGMVCKFGFWIQLVHCKTTMLTSRGS